MWIVWIQFCNMHHIQKNEKKKRKETQKRKICTNVCSYTSNIWSYIRFTHTPAPLSLNFLTTENWRWYDAGGFLKSLLPSSIGKPLEQLKGCDSEHKRQEKSRTSVILHLKWMRFKCQKKNSPFLLLIFYNQLTALRFMANFMMLYHKMRLERQGDIYKHYIVMEIFNPKLICYKKIANGQYPTLATALKPVYHSGTEIDFRKKHSFCKRHEHGTIFI